MRCDTVTPLLEDFADRSLPIAAAWRVRHHLKTCAACREVLAEAQVFGRDVCDLYTISQAPSPDLRARILRAAPSTITLVPVGSRRWSLAKVGGISALGTTAIVAAALLVWLTPGTPIRPSVGFAQVEAAMQQVKTVHWIEENRSSSREGEPLGRPLVIEKWARLDPPAMAEKRLPISAPLPPGTQENYFHRVMNAHKQVMHDSIGDKYTITNTDRWGKQNGFDRDAMLRNMIVSETLSPGSASRYARAIARNAVAAAALKKFKNPIPKPSLWKSRPVIEKGRTLILFERDIPQWKTPSGGANSLPLGPTTEQIWVEPNTCCVVRREQTRYFPNTKEIAYQVTGESFRYNENLPLSTFVLTPPPGAEVKYEEERRSTQVWDELPAREKHKIQAVINASDKGWKTGTFSAFALVWDFDFVHRLDPVLDSGSVRWQQWAFRVAQQKNNWVEWQSTVTSVSERNFYHNYSFAPDMPNILAVEVSVRGRPSGVKGRNWQGASTFYLRRTKNRDYKIVEWEEQPLWAKYALPSLLERGGTR